MSETTVRADVRQMPWLASLLDQCQRMLRQARVPHALSIEGPAGLGKTALAEHLQAWLLCAQPVGHGPCGHCAECQLLAAGHHPDLIRQDPDSKSGRQITVDAVRSLRDRLTLRPQRQGRQVALLVPAEAMNESAANALLKTLEEPSADAHLLLVTHQPARLPITILSRCVRLTASVPDDSVQRTWLEAQGVTVDEVLLQQTSGRPLRAVAAQAQSLPAQWSQLQSVLDACASGRVSPAICAMQLGGQVDLLLDYLSRQLEWMAARQLQPGSHGGLTSSQWQSTLSDAWQACRRMAGELGSGLREDLALARILQLYCSVRREWKEDPGMRRVKG